MSDRDNDRNVFFTMDRATRDEMMHSALSAAKRHFLGWADDEDWDLFEEKAVTELREYLQDIRWASDWFEKSTHSPEQSD